MPREDFDKKGEPARVFDIIWNPDTVKRGKNEAQFRQALVELSFAYVFEKYKLELDLSKILFLNFRVHCT
jgi:hypothetical protein